MCRCAEYVWHKVPRKVFTDISRRVVSVVSFKGEKIYFACTGLLISWHERARTRVLILTLASLVRSADDEDEIDKNLRIEVFLPPNQRADGRLELYHLNHNIAIISVEKSFCSPRKYILHSRKVI
uniref:Uncharacterized protein n=1 Tax=Triticum urartu TaxID=4572 RepID=A0A8R7V0W7_TRIUA